MQINNNGNGTSATSLQVDNPSVDLATAHQNNDSGASMRKLATLFLGAASLLPSSGCTYNISMSNSDSNTIVKQPVPEVIERHNANSILTVFENPAKNVGANVIIEDAVLMEYNSGKLLYNGIHTSANGQVHAFDYEMRSGFTNYKITVLTDEANPTLPLTGVFCQKESTNGEAQYYIDARTPQPQNQQAEVSLFE